jgi:myo-inositol 2-dehydrogenase / D-chiro-inositol 1-dehydrogenase
MESTVSTWGERGCASDALQNFFLDRYAEAYRREMAHFAAILRQEVSPAVGYRDAVAALTLAEAAGLSVKTNKPVSVRSV